MKYLNLLLQVCFFVVLVIVIWSAGPYLETKFMPVYSRFDAVTIEPHDDGTLVKFQYTKLRNCDPQGFSFFEGDIGASFRQIVVQPLATLPNPRPVGEQVSLPYLFRGISPTTFRRNVFGEIYNRCHPLWTTRSVIYP